MNAENTTGVTKEAEVQLPELGADPGAIPSLGPAVGMGMSGTPVSPEPGMQGTPVARGRAPALETQHTEMWTQKYKPVSRGPASVSLGLDPGAEAFVGTSQDPDMRRGDGLSGEREVRLSESTQGRQTFNRAWELRFLWQSPRLLTRTSWVLSLSLHSHRGHGPPPAARGANVVSSKSCWHLCHTPNPVSQNLRVLVTLVHS